MRHKRRRLRATDMKIGIMLRHYEQHGGGVKVYTQNLMRELAHLDTGHEFVFIYRDPRLVGTHGNNGGRVREIAVQAPSVLFWDQLAVPWAAKREKCEVLFNPKYSIPLKASCPAVFVSHGLDWYVMPEGYRWFDGLNYRYVMPLYAKQSSAIIAVSNTAREHVIEFLGMEPRRVFRVYHGVDDAFKKPVPVEATRAVRQAHSLPDRFFLYVGQIYPPKNFGRLLKAYAVVGPSLGIPLVVLGEHRWLCERELALIDELGISAWLLWPGWVAREQLPAWYAMAEALLLPSLYESFGIPVVEAMASGCPVITANRYATRELAEGAALLVNPEEVEEIAGQMRCIATDANLRHSLVAAGRKRAARFTWRKCAEETLAVLETVSTQN